MCCVPLGCTAPWEGMSSPTLSLLSVGVQASGHLLLPWSSKKRSSQVGSLTPPADMPGVSTCARIATEIPCSSCTGIFSSDRWDWFFSASHQAGSSASSQPGSAARTWPAQDNRGCLQCLALCCWERQLQALLWGEAAFLILREFHPFQLLAMISSVEESNL